MSLLPVTVDVTVAGMQRMHDAIKEPSIWTEVDVRMRSTRQRFMNLTMDLSGCATINSTSGALSMATTTPTPHTRAIMISALKDAVDAAA